MLILSERSWTYRLCESITRKPRKGKTTDEQLLPGHQRVEARKGILPVKATRENLRWIGMFYIKTEVLLATQLHTVDKIHGSYTLKYLKALKRYGRISKN